jgi:heme exporter protein D
LATGAIPSGFVSTAAGTGDSDQPTTTEPRARSGQLPVTPELYLQNPSRTGAGAALPTIWRLWWNQASQQALTVSLAQYSDTSMADQSISQLNAALTGTVGNSGLTLTSVFVPQGLPGAHGYNLASPTSATPSKSPFTVSAVLYRSGDIEYMDTILTAGTEPASGAVSSFAVAQYRAALARALAHPGAVIHHATTWPWIAGGAALVILVLVAFVARRRAVIRRRRHRRHRHAQQRRPRGTARGTPGVPVSR